MTTEEELKKLKAELSKVKLEKIALEKWQQQDTKVLIAKRQSEDVVRLVSDMKGLLEYIISEGTQLDDIAIKSLRSLVQFITIVDV